MTQEPDQIVPSEFRRVLGAVPTSVAVIGADVDGLPVGVSVGSFMSISLEPPLVGFFIAETSTTWSVIAPRGEFTASILAASQEGVCRTFASRGVDRFANCAWRAGNRGHPIIENSVAWLDCDIESVIDIGDHKLVVGLVRAMEADPEEVPLVFVRGGYSRPLPVGTSTGWA